MKIGIVPSSLLQKTRRLDADIYLGDKAEKKILRARENLRRAKIRLQNAKKEKKQRDKQRKQLGIRIPRQ